MKKLFEEKVVLYAGVCLMIIGIAGMSNEGAQTAVAPEQERAATIVEDALSASISSNANGTVVRHDGISGQSALNVLRSGAEVMVDQSVVEKTIIAINGVTGEDDQSWSLFVNGERVGPAAIAYISDDGDELEWRLVESS